MIKLQSVKCVRRSGKNCDKSVLLTRRIKRARLLKSCDFAGKWGKGVPLRPITNDFSSLARFTHLVKSTDLSQFLSLGY